MKTLVGVISDTHGLPRPQAVDALRGADIFPNDMTETFERRSLVDHGELWSQSWQMVEKSATQVNKHRLLVGIRVCFNGELESLS